MNINVTICDEGQGANHSAPIKQEIGPVVGMPIITLTREEIEQGLELVQIDVVDRHGQIGRFWIDMRVSQKGAPALTVATKTPDGKDLTKIQSGFWKHMRG